MHRRELTLGDSNNNKESSADRKSTVKGVPVNFFIKDSSYEYRKANHAFVSCPFIVQRYEDYEELIRFSRDLITCVKSKYPKRQIYISNSLPFAIKILFQINFLTKENSR